MLNTFAANSVASNSLTVSQPPTVIHSPTNSQDETISDEEAKRRRELLARRPSYRKILHDLSEMEKDLAGGGTGGGEGGGGVSVLKQEAADSDSGAAEGRSAGREQEGGTAPSGSSHHTSHTVTTSLAPPPADLSTFPAAPPAMLPTGIPTLPNNGELGGLGALSSTLLQQYTGGVGPGEPSVATTQQLLVSVNNDLLGLKPVTGSPLIPGVAATSAFVNQGLMPGYSPHSPMGGVGRKTPSSSDNGDAAPNMAGSTDAQRKRQVRLLKNREAAKECRRKKKEYVKCLENRVAVLENQNKALIEELKTLKELYCRKGD